MRLTIADLKVPIVVDESGTARIAETRVTLHSLVRDFQEGAAPEALVAHYDALKLADVYAVIAFYLSHQADVEQHLLEYEKKGEELRRQVEAEYPTKALREHISASNGAALDPLGAIDGTLLTPVRREYMYE